MQFSAAMLPDDVERATLAGRVALPEGPTPVLIRGGMVEDVSRAAPTVADLIERGGFDSVEGRRLFTLEELCGRAEELLLSPIDLQIVKAAGVTFAISAIERVIEERARGNSDRALEIRQGLEARIGGAIRSVVPGTEEAAALKRALIEDGLWSQYLEVAQIDVVAERRSDRLALWIDGQHHFRLGIVPVRIGADADLGAPANGGENRHLGEDLGVRPDRDFEILRPEAVLDQRPLQRGRLVGAGNDRTDRAADARL